MKEWQGYKVNSFSLICIPKSNNPVFAIKMPDKVLLQGLLGTWHNGKFYKSIDDLIYEITSKYPEYKSNE